MSVPNARRHGWQRRAAWLCIFQPWLYRARCVRRGGAPDLARLARRQAKQAHTVLRSVPASCAAECAQPVTSYASRISMISLPDLVTVPPGRDE
jgi:hypothetical protein